MSLTAERLRGLLDYDPYTGVFRWRCKPNRRIAVGAVAGTTCRGRVQIRVDGRIYRAHRLAWLHVTGCWPQMEIDHINGDPSNNRLSNLRDVPRKQNKHKPQRRNKLGILGVSPASHGGYRARVSGKHIGTFRTIQDANQAYLRAKRDMHPESNVWQK